MPSWKLFRSQSPEYRNQVLPPAVPLVTIEAGTPLGWQRYIGQQVETLGVDQFGKSAPGDVLMREYGFTVENVCDHVRRLLGREHP